MDLRSNWEESYTVLAHYPYLCLQRRSISPMDPFLRASTTLVVRTQDGSIVERSESLGRHNVAENDEHEETSSVVPPPPRSLRFVAQVKRVVNDRELSPSHEGEGRSDDEDDEERPKETRMKVKTTPATKKTTTTMTTKKKNDKKNTEGRPSVKLASLRKKEAERRREKLRKIGFVGVDKRPSSYMCEEKDKKLEEYVGVNGEEDRYDHDEEYELFCCVAERYADDDEHEYLYKYVGWELDWETWDKDQGGQIMREWEKVKKTSKATCKRKLNDGWTYISRIHPPTEHA